MSDSTITSLNEMNLSRPGMDGISIRDDILRYFHFTLGRDQLQHSKRYLLQALALAVRDRLAAAANSTRHAFGDADARRTAYMSLEFLQGRALNNALLNLDIDDATRTSLHALGAELEELVELEHDAGLGNGGLGRLAACFLDSCASLGLPVFGYGIRYQYGMFRQP